MMVGSLRPRRNGARVSQRSTGRRGRTTVSIGCCAAVIARILARPTDKHERPGPQAPRERPDGPVDSEETGPPRLATLPNRGPSRGWEGERTGGPGPGRGSGPGSGACAATVSRLRYRAWTSVGGTAERSVVRYSAAAAWR